jgi:DNA transformation protein
MADMEVQNEFITYLLELLEPLGPVKAKAMFGGFGIYLDDIMFGLVTQNIFYLKVDDQNRSDFESRGLKPFTYIRKGKEYTMSYYKIPNEAIDNIDELCKWAEKAYEVAVRSAKSKHKKKRGKDKEEIL